MQPDTTFVTPVMQVITNPAVINVIVGGIVGILAYVFGMFKIPKSIAARLVQYGAIIVISIMETEQKAKQQEARGNAMLDSMEKEVMATEYAVKAMAKSPNRDFFGKVTKILGGVGSVINVAFPIVKPFLKKG